MSMIPSISDFPTQNEFDIFQSVYHPYNITINQFQFVSDFKKMLYNTIPHVQVKELKDIGVLRFNIEDTSLDDVKNLMDGLHKLSPQSEFVAIPSDYDLEGMTKEHLIQIRDKIDKMIEASDFDAFTSDGVSGTNIQNEAPPIPLSAPTKINKQ